jgi:hypothetical protein
MRKHHKPPQGTAGPINFVKYQSMKEWGANQILSDLQVHQFLQAEDEDYLAMVELKREGMFSDKRAAPHLINMSKKYSSEMVGRAFRFVKFTPWQFFVEK